MSLRQAWRQTTIANKFSVCFAGAAIAISVVSAIFNYGQVVVARSQYRLAAQAKKDQNLLEWTRLTFEDNAAMPSILAVTIPFKAANDMNNVVIQLRNVGNGSTTEMFVDDAVTGRDLIPPVANLAPGDQISVTVPANRLDRTRLMRLVCKSPHGSVRTKTFYFLADSQSKTVSDVIDHSFDFLIADQPGRETYIPAARFGFGPPANSK